MKRIQKKQTEKQDTQKKRTTRKTTKTIEEQLKETNAILQRRVCVSVDDSVCDKFIFLQQKFIEYNENHSDKQVKLCLSWSSKHCVWRNIVGFRTKEQLKNETQMLQYFAAEDWFLDMESIAISEAGKRYDAEQRDNPYNVFINQRHFSNLPEHDQEQVYLPYLVNLLEEQTNVTVPMDFYYYAEPKYHEFILSLFLKNDIDVQNRNINFVYNRYCCDFNCDFNCFVPRFVIDPSMLSAFLISPKARNVNEPKILLEINEWLIKFGYKRQIPWRGMMIWTMTQWARSLSSESISLASTFASIARSFCVKYK